MITTIAVSSGNVHKIQEIRTLLDSKEYNVCSVTDILGYYDDVVEDGDTFEANAIKKVNELPCREGVLYLSDDSGICVNALDGRPGIYSARYGGRQLSHNDKCRRLISELEGKDDRSAYYMCVIALKFPDGQIKTASGRMDGQIGYELIGTEGFGYDPIFFPENYSVTCAQLSAEEKHTISHRGKAIKAALRLL